MLFVYIVLIISLFGSSRSLNYPDSLTVGLPWVTPNGATAITQAFQSTDSQWAIFNQTWHLSDVHLPSHDEFQTYLKACRLWKDTKTTSFISDMSCSERRKHGALVGHLELPHVSVSRDVCFEDRKNKDMVHFDAKIEHPLTVLESVISHVGWTKLIVIYDDSVNRNGWLDDFISLTGELNISVSLQYINPSEGIDVFLSEVQPVTDEKYPFVLFTDLNSTLQLLANAQAEYMRTIEYSWLMYGQDVDIRCLLPYLQTEDNIAILSVNNDTNPYKEIAAQSLLTAYEKVINNNDWYDNFGVSSKCKGKMSWRAKNTMINSLNEDVKDLEVCHNCSQYTVRSSVTFQDGIPRLIPVAEYQRTEGLVNFEKFYPNSFNGFNNRTFHVTSLVYSFFQRKRKMPDGSIKWEGLTFEILNELAHDLNFTYVVSEPADGEWGIKKPDGNWTGMIAEVADKRVDFAAACFSITVQREEVVDFAAPYFHEQSVVIMKRPEDDGKIMLYAYPFRWEVWICILLTVGVSSITLHIYTMFTPVYDHWMPWKVYKASRRFIFDRVWSFWYIFGALLQQGNCMMPEAQSGRMLVGAFWFFSIVVMATYTGNLIAFLAVDKVKMPFDTLYSMVGQTSVKYGPSKGVALVMLFRDATFEPYKSVAANMILAPGYGVGLDWVKSGNYAFIAEKSWFNSISADDCDIAMAKEEFYPTNYGWAFQPGAPFLKLFSDRIDKMRETGLLDNWIQKWTPKNLKCRGLGPITNARIASLKDFQGGFYVLVSGIVLGIIALLAEYIASRCLKRKLPKLDEVAGTSRQQEEQVDENPVVKVNPLPGLVSVFMDEDKKQNDDLQEIS